MAKDKAPSGAPLPGQGVDFAGNPVIDPTENVKALSEAANKRQDDLRELQDRLNSAEVRHVKEIGEIRAAHVKELAEIREAHAERLRVTEASRLDSIRQVDVTAVKTEADRALAAIQTLAATTQTNAENLRNALTNTAATIAKQTSDTVNQITERIAALEKSSYEGVGKQRIADPQMVDLLNEVRRLSDLASGGAGQNRGIGISWGVLLGVGSLLVMLVAIVGFILKR